MGTTTFRGQRQPWERERTQSPPPQGARCTPTTAPGCGSRETKTGGGGGTSGPSNRG